MSNNTTGFRLSAEQERVCTQQLDTPFAAHCTVNIDGALRPELLKQAIHNVMQHHEILRTVYRRQTGLKLPFQVILDASEAAWNLVDTTSTQTPILNLESGPIVHASLQALETNKHTLALTLP